MAKQKGVKNNSTPKKQCEQCKRNISINQFYNTNSAFSADGKLNICKKCVEEIIDCNNIETIYKVLQLMDIPFLYEYWNTAVEKNSDNPWGIYIRMANSKINEFKNKTWKDSNFKNTNDENKNSNRQNFVNSIKPSDFEVTDEIIEKWGAGYKFDEYQAFERKYNFLKNNYPEKTAMHTEALLNYIRYRVKEEMSTALGLVKEAKEWGSLAKDAATAAKINPSQLSKADLTEGLSTFGELVRAVEQSVDIIPILPKFKSKPQDKVDFTLWCYINYIRDLKGLPPCEYKDIYQFYEERKQEYEKRDKENKIFDETQEDSGDN